MSLQTWQETLISAQVTGSTFASFTTAKTVLPVGCLVTLPANWWYIGRTIRVTCVMGVSNIVTTPGTIVFQTNIGAVAAFSSGTVQMNAIAHTLLPVVYEAIITCRAVGSGTSANLIGITKLNGIMLTKTAAQVDQVNIGDSILGPQTAPAVGTGFDSTAAGTLDFFVGFSISAAGNAVAVYQYLVEAMN